MTLIECPKCKKEVDIDSPTVTKQLDGLELIITCTKCKTRFILQGIAEARKTLLTAQYGIVKSGGAVKRVKLK